MTRTEQNGIDILCDAAGSDLLISSYFSLAASEQTSHHQSQPQSQPQQLQPQTPRSRSSPSVPSKRKLSDGPPAAASHVCHICKRVYERADHLTRHLRSHENARPYQCSRCPKRFNRADLLTRHETTHDRDGAAKGRPFIRRSDRAAEACLNCAASKAKCEDQKPCGRCRSKDLACQMPPRRGSQYRTSGIQTAPPPSPKVVSTTTTTGVIEGPFTGFGNESADSPKPLIGFHNRSHGSECHGDVKLSSDGTLQGPTFGIVEDLTFGPEGNQFRDIDCSWEFNFEGLSISRLGLTSSRLRLVDRLQMSPIQRDKLFAMVVSHSHNLRQTPLFPSLELLSHILRAYFSRFEYDCGELIHLASFDSASTTPELLAVIVSSAASRIPQTTIWQFGLALDEVVRRALAQRIEDSKTMAQDLATLQCFMLHLDVGQWSGYSRKMRMAEGFFQPLLTMLRRCGKTFSSPEWNIPTRQDSPDVVEIKWKQFIAQESYRRLLLHLFFHDVESSVGLCKNPLISCHELRVSVPASRDLWQAQSAEEWRDIYLTKGQGFSDGGVPLLTEMAPGITVLDELGDCIDIDLCYKFILYRYWGQIASYHDAAKFYTAGRAKSQTTTLPHWLVAQRQELYGDMSGFVAAMQTSQRSNIQRLLVAELLMMILHVSVYDLQRFVGKNGKGEAQQAAQELQHEWLKGPGSRRAIWHAGQVIRLARKLAPASLRDFNAVAFYFACLTLWTYSCLAYNSSQSHGEEDGNLPSEEVLLDTESHETQALLQFNDGGPALTNNGGHGAGTVRLSNTTMIISTLRDVLRGNFPLDGDCMPPLVESIWHHLGHLDMGCAGQERGYASEDFLL